VADKINTGLHAIMSRKGHYARDDISSLKVIVPNFYLQNGSEPGPGGSATITASIEYPEGTFTALTWAGGSSATPADGALAVSDYLDIAIPNDEVFWTRLYYSNASGVMYSTDVSDDAMGDQCDLNGADKTLTGSMADTPNYIFGPAAVIARTSRPTVCLIGDSRMKGIFDTFSGSSGDKGEIARSIGPEFGYMDMSVVGEPAATFIGHHAKRALLLPYCSHVISNYGINDVQVSGASAADTLGYLQTIWGYATALGKRVFQTTLPPETTSSDDWATVDNQTVMSGNAARKSLNALLRAGPDGVDGVFDITAAVESGFESGKWQAPDYTTDGIHETLTANLAIKTAYEDEIVGAIGG
jgi:hypothetical protein